MHGITPVGCGKYNVIISISVVPVVANVFEKIVSTQLNLIMWINCFTSTGHFALPAFHYENSTEDIMLLMELNFT